MAYTDVIVQETKPATPAEVKRAIDDLRTGYTANEGMIELRRAIVDKLRRDQGATYGPAQRVAILIASKDGALTLGATIESEAPAPPAANVDVELRATPETASFLLDDELLEGGVDEVRPLLRVHLLRCRGRALDVGEEHRHRASLTDHSASRPSTHTSTQHSNNNLPLAPDIRRPPPTLQPMVLPGTRSPVLCEAVPDQLRHLRTPVLSPGRTRPPVPVQHCSA